MAIRIIIFLYVDFIYINVLEATLFKALKTEKIKQKEHRLVKG